MTIQIDPNDIYFADDVRRLMKMAKLEEQKPGATLGEFVEHLMQGEKIKCIKDLRDSTGLGLTEAKQFFERWFESSQAYQDAKGMRDAALRERISRAHPY
jgi:ribosomal protein L7/L12